MKVAVPSGEPVLVSTSVTLPSALIVFVSCPNCPVNTAMSLPPPPSRMAGVVEAAEGVGQRIARGRDPGSARVDQVFHVIGHHIGTEIGADGVGAAVRLLDNDFIGSCHDVSVVTRTADHGINDARCSGCAGVVKGVIAVAAIQNRVSAGASGQRVVAGQTPRWSGLCWGRPRYRSRCRYLPFP